MVSDIVGLRSTLDSLARTTWTDIADGRRLGVGMGEVGITDRNMLALRREHPSLLIHKHSVHEEVRTGADWEWWLGTSGGWVCLVFQAKLLNAHARYAGLTKGREEGKPQVDVLLRSCLQRSERLNGTVWPLYCFYNSWQGAWPRDVPRSDGTDPRMMSTEELRLYGCAAADAWSVRRVLLDSNYSNRRTVRDSYLPVSQPWSMIFADPAESTINGPGPTMMTTLAASVSGRARLPPGLQPVDTGEADSGEEGRRDRQAVYRDPVLIIRPPDYVFDLLEGTIQPRRLKPLARRVVILPESV